MSTQPSKPSVHVLRSNDGDVAILLADTRFNETDLVEMEIAKSRLLLRQGAETIDMRLDNLVMNVLAPAKDITLLELREGDSEPSDAPAPFHIEPGQRLVTHKVERKVAA